MSTETGTPTERSDLARSDQSLRERIFDNPRPALGWLAVFTVVLVPELGAVLHAGAQALLGILKIVPGDPAVKTATELVTATGDVPTLLSRSLIDNQGYQTVAGEWKGTFSLGGVALSPKHAWLLRVSMVYAYAAVFAAWLWRGYRTYRAHYRIADWTPADDQIDRFRGHTWGRVELVVVAFFLVMALFAPALGPTTIEQNIKQPYSYEVKYLDEDAETVKSITVGVANIKSASRGGEDSVGPWSYDDFGRFHPAGTLKSGKDMATFLVHGARVSLFIGITSIVLAGFIAVALALITAYYKGLADLTVVVSSDSIQSIPVFLLIIMAFAIFSEVFNGSLLLISFFAITNWTFIWRAIRGPALQVAEEEWIDAARSYGQTPRKTMQGHMLPYVLGYLLVYSSMRVGGIIVAIAGLSYLGLGVKPPTPEWGRAISSGQSLVATSSWHIAFIPGFLITLLVTGLNALGDGIRDAIDPQSEAGDDGEMEAQGGGA
ncbi:MAG: ABC transporter permease [Halobaculum sp.]